MRNLMFFFCLLLCSCKSKEYSNIFHTEDLGLKYKKLVKIGYTPIKENKSIYFKVKKDTSIYITLDRYNVAINKEWVIKFPSLDYSLIDEFLSGKQIFNVTTKQFFNDGKDCSFVSLGQLDNCIYICKVVKDKEGDGSSLHINTTKQYTKKQIERNIKYYNDIFKKGLSHPDILPSLEDEK